MTSQEKMIANFLASKQWNDSTPMRITDSPFTTANTARHAVQAWEAWKADQPEVHPWVLKEQARDGAPTISEDLPAAKTNWLGMTGKLPLPKSDPFEQSVDPWAMQRDVMARSGQPLPAMFTFSKGTLLYLALCIEEVGELCMAVLKGTDHATFGSTHSPFVQAHINSFSALRDLIRNTGLGLTMGAGIMRTRIGQLPDDIQYQGDMTKAAVDMLDGATDLIVVAVGFLNATGMNGPGAYREVYASNISKANPITGVIDKDTSGKWIKGTGYKAPDLGLYVNVLTNLPLDEPKDNGTTAV